MTDTRGAANDGADAARSLAISTLTPLFSPDVTASTSPFDVLLKAIEAGSDGDIGGDDLLRVTAGLHGLAFSLVRELAASRNESPLAVLRRLALVTPR